MGDIAQRWPKAPHFDDRMAIDALICVKEWWKVRRTAKR